MFTFLLYIGITVLSSIFFYKLWNRFLIGFPIKVNGESIVSSKYSSEISLDERMSGALTTRGAFLNLLFCLGVAYPLLYSMVHSMGSDGLEGLIVAVMFGSKFLDIRVIYGLLIVTFCFTLFEHIRFRVRFKINRVLHDENK
ncbi:hypothetical protein MOD96_01795 [Bacillus sp. S17B2]|uniref:hypothetical protein n=1 Tax=Bacillus sp. S17B2 TaxID=2918907 RepID=UPI0022802A37|nr:hypothetical protein [Bacillus sp. S17B2]